MNIYNYIKVLSGMYKLKLFFIEKKNYRVGINQCFKIKRVII